MRDGLDLVDADASLKWVALDVESHGEYVSVPGAPGKFFSHLPLVRPVFSHFLSRCWGPVVV